MICLSKKKEFGLTTMSKNLTKNSGAYLKQVQAELVQEEEEAIKDFIKGAYRLVMEKEKEVQSLQEEIVNIRKAIDKATSGNWEALGNLKIPARFFNESTLRKHGKSLLDGSSELRIMELYAPNSDEE